VRRHRPRKVMTQPRTSLTDPLPILPVLPAPGAGRIGITFCPGKIDPAATPAPWRRDLAADLVRLQVQNSQQRLAGLDSTQQRVAHHRPCTRLVGSRNDCLRAPVDLAPRNAGQLHVRVPRFDSASHHEVLDEESRLRTLTRARCRLEHTPG
jgi:hypothetical protein